MSSDGSAAATTPPIIKGGYEVVYEGGPLTKGFIFFEFLMLIVFFFAHITIRAKRRGARNRYERLDNILGTRAEIGLEALGGLAMGMGLGVGGGLGGNNLHSTSANTFLGSASPAGRGSIDGGALSSPTGTHNAVGNGSVGGSPNINISGLTNTNANANGMGMRRTISGFMGSQSSAVNNPNATTAAPTGVNTANNSTATVVVAKGSGGGCHSRTSSVGSCHSPQPLGLTVPASA